MATSLNSCAGEAIVSFPLKTSITDLKAYFKSIEKEKPDITANYTTRLNNPNFSDDSRTNGEIDDPLNSIELSYNDNDYKLLNTQLTISTHSEWIPNVNPSRPIQNKIDLIVTLETKREEVQPRFVILVVPIVLDNTATVNNPYLAGLAYLTNDSIYSLSSIFNGLTNYIFYTTCLAPHGDKAFVYVNIDTIKINSDLYHNLLSVWTQQSLSSIQTRILDNLSPVQKSLSKLFQNVKDAKNLQEIQQQINNIQASAQNPVINSMVETWPRYSPPYDIILNVPSKPITNSSSVEGFQNIEHFQVAVTINGDLSSSSGGSSSSSSGGSSSSSSSGSRTSSTGGASSSSNIRKREELKCISLDVNDAVDASGNINFDASGNVSLGQIEASREKRRTEYNSNQLKYVDLIKYTSPFFAGLIVIGVLYFIALPYIKARFFPTAALPPGAVRTGSFIVYGLIFIFGGFLIGAAVAKAY